MHRVGSFSPLIEKAIEFASRWHEGTYRKSAWRTDAIEGEDRIRIPAISHVTAVAMIVARMGFDETTIAAAFLHDTVEDPNQHGHYISLSTIETMFGEDVSQMVGSLTEIKRNAQGEYHSWETRKTGYVAALRTASTGAKAISLADKVHNLWTMNQALARELPIFEGSETLKAMSAGPQQQRWYFEEILDATSGVDDVRVQSLRSLLAAEVDAFIEHTNLV